MRETMSLSFQRFFFIAGSALATIAILYIGRTFFVPLAFALLLSFILYPLSAWFEKRGMNRIWSTITAVVSFSLIMAGLLVLFSTQFVAISRHFGDFTLKLYEIAFEVTAVINKVPVIGDMSSWELIQRGEQWVNNSGGELMKGTLTATGTFLSGLGLTLIYTFLLLLYRAGLRKALMGFACVQKQCVYDDMIHNIQRVGKRYLTGMFLLIIILGVLNSAGLFILGIDYALFFGFLASFMAIMPYIGTSVGALIPTIYALMNFNSLWYPVGVVAIFTFIQIIDGNFLTPKIVGGNLQLNALVAISSLIVGGLLWGIPGMILFLPYTAVFKEICRSYKQLEPVTHILENNLYELPDTVKEKSE